MASVATAPAQSAALQALAGRYAQAEGGPLVIGDTMYVNTPFPNIVYALDLNDDGRVIWKYEPKQDPSVIPVMCCDTVNRGVSYADGRIFQYQADTTLVSPQLSGRVTEVLVGDNQRVEAGQVLIRLDDADARAALAQAEANLDRELSLFEAP